MSDPCILESKFDRFEGKLDAISSDIGDLKVTQERLVIISEIQKENLTEHMRRTVAIENRVQQFEQVIAAQKKFYGFMGWLVPIIVSIIAVCFKVFF